MVESSGIDFGRVVLDAIEVGLESRTSVRKWAIIPAANNYKLICYVLPGSRLVTVDVEKCVVECEGGDGVNFGLSGLVVEFADPDLVDRVVSWLLTWKSEHRRV